jgi:hypothetical protein
MPTTSATNKKRLRKIEFEAAIATTNKIIFIKFLTIKTKIMFLNIKDGFLLIKDLNIYLIINCIFRLIFNIVQQDIPHATEDKIERQKAQARQWCTQAAETRHEQAAVEAASDTQVSLCP